MNLSLYIEATQIISRQRDKTKSAISGSFWIGDQLPALPDSIYEELGYYGALDGEGSADADSDEAFEDLLRMLGEPAFSF